MSLPEWVESVSGLVGKLSAVPIRLSKNAVLGAEYLAITFTAAVVGMVDEGLATPLRELSASKLQKIKSTDISEAAEAHNKSLKQKAEADKVHAEAELIRAQAQKVDAETRSIDGATLLAQLEHQRKLAENRRQLAEDRLRKAVQQLEDARGKLYLDPPSEEDTFGNVSTDDESNALDRAISELDLSSRTMNVLDDGGIRSVQQLVHMSQKELLKIRGFGRTSLREVINALSEHGLKLKPDQNQ